MGRRVGICMAMGGRSLSESIDWTLRCIRRRMRIMIRFGDSTSKSKGVYTLIEIYDF